MTKLYCTDVMKSDDKSIDSSPPTVEGTHPSASSMAASSGVNRCSNQACNSIHAAANNHQQSPTDSTVTLHHLGQLSTFQAPPIQLCTSACAIPNSTSRFQLVPPDFSHRQNHTFHSEPAQIASATWGLGHTHSKLDINVGGLGTCSGLEYAHAAGSGHVSVASNTRHSITGLETVGHVRAGLGHVHGGSGHVRGLGYALGQVGAASINGHTRYSHTEVASPYSVGDQSQNQQIIASSLLTPARSHNGKDLPVPVSKV